MVSNQNLMNELTASVLATKSDEEITAERESASASIESNTMMVDSGMAQKVDTINSLHINTTHEVMEKIKTTVPSPVIDKIIDLEAGKDFNIAGNAQYLKNLRSQLYRFFSAHDKLALEHELARVNAIRTAMGKAALERFSIGKQPSVGLQNKMVVRMVKGSLNIWHRPMPEITMEDGGNNG